MAHQRSLSLILIRHTQTDENVDKMYSCQRDVPLNPNGLLQATSLAWEISGRQVAAIYASDLRRTRLVAEIIGIHHRHTPLIADRRLRELDMGGLSGMTKDVVLARYPEARFRTTDGAYDFSSVGGETRNQVISRQLSLLREVRKRHTGSPGTIVLVGHGTAVRNLLEALGFSEKMHKQGGYTELELSHVPSDPA